MLNPDSLRTAAIAALPGGVVIAVDHDLRVLMCEGQELARHGYEAELLVGRLLADILPTGDYESLETHYRAALGGKTVTHEHSAARSGTYHLIHLAPVMHDGEVVAAIAVSQDVTARRRAEEELRAVTTRFETAFAAAPIGMALVGLDGGFLRCNRALCDLTGYPEDELVALTFQDITHPDDLNLDLAHLERLITGAASSYTMEKRYLTKRGNEVWVLLAVSLVRDDSGAPSHFISQIKDITETRAMESRLRTLANHDAVTDLLNRRRFEDELVRQVGRCRRYAETACLMLLDLDAFKSINDLHGHRVGDAALQEVASILRSRLRSSDVVARVGGDEFAALLPGVSAEDSQDLAEQVRAAIEQTSVDAAGSPVSMTASIGLMTLDVGTADEDDAFVGADRAMYDAKARGRNRVSVASN